jgi:hypothetical protein
MTFVSTKTVTVMQLVSRWITGALRADPDGRAGQRKSHRGAISRFLAHHVDQKITDKPGYTGIELGGSHAGPSGGVFRQCDRDVLHYTKSMFHESSVNHRLRKPLANHPRGTWDSSCHPR